MKFASFLTCILASALAAEALSIPAAVERRDFDSFKRDLSLSDLFKRKGGGGGGKGGSSGGSSSSSSSSSSSGSSGSSSGSSGGARTGSTSNTGGATSAGSGAPRSYGGGAYYGGGATTPYAAGQKTPKGIAPVALLGLGALAFFPGLWLYGAYMYPYSHPYYWYNSTSGRNESKPVNCLCEQYSECGCDDNDDQAYLNSTLGNFTNLNDTLVRVADVNGTSQVFLNGTLPNGTTASGGTDSAALSLSGKALENMGWCLVGTVIATAMWTL